MSGAVTDYITFSHTGAHTSHPASKKNNAELALTGTTPTPEASATATPTAREAASATATATASVMPLPMPTSSATATVMAAPMPTTARVLAHQRVRGHHRDRTIVRHFQLCPGFHWHSSQSQCHCPYCQLSELATTACQGPSSGADAPPEHRSSFAHSIRILRCGDDGSSTGEPHCQYGSVHSEHAELHGVLRTTAQGHHSWG